MSTDEPRAEPTVSKKVAGAATAGTVSFVQTKLAGFILGLLTKLFYAGVLALVALSPMCVTQIRDYDLVVLRKWGQRVEGEIAPGLKWYWPIINTVHRYDVRPRAIKIDGKEEGTELSGINALSRESWSVGVMTDITYTLDRHKWEAIDDNFGSDDTAETRRQIENRIKVDVRYAIQNLMPQYNLEYLLTHRSELLQNAYVILGLASEEVPGTQEVTTVDGAHKAIEVKIIKPLPVQRLSEVGVVIRNIAIQFNLPPEYDAIQKKNAADREKERVAAEKANDLKSQQKVAREQAELAKIEAQGKADVESTLLRTKQAVSSDILFLEKWNGKLPEVMAGSGKADSIVSDIIGAESARKFSKSSKSE